MVRFYAVRLICRSFGGVSNPPLFLVSHFKFLWWDSYALGYLPDRCFRPLIPISWLWTVLSRHIDFAMLSRWNVFALASGASRLTALFSSGEIKIADRYCWDYCPYRGFLKLLARISLEINLSPLPLCDRLHFRYWIVSVPSIQDHISICGSFTNGNRIKFCALAC